MLLSVHCHLQKGVSVSKNFSCWPKYLGKRSLCSWNQPRVLRNCHKSLLSPERNKLKEIWDTVWLTKDSWRQWCQNKPFSEFSVYLFCSSKQVHFFKFSFRQIYFLDKFWKRQFFSIVNVWLSLPNHFFTKEHPLPYKHTTWNPRWNDVETTFSTLFQRGIHLVCL